MIRYSATPGRSLARMLAGACVIAVATLAQAATDTPENFVQWRPGLASSAQPGVDILKRAKALGYDVVINLAPPQSQGSIENEGGIVGKQGVVYVNIPVNFGNPTAEDFRVFSDVMKSMAKKNVLVHCQVNLRGTSFTLLYRVIHEGAAMDESRAKLNSVWVPDPVWKKFIESTLAANGKAGEVF